MRGNKCPVHGIPDCSPLLNGCNLPTRLAEVESLRADLAAALARNAELEDERERLKFEMQTLRSTPWHQRMVKAEAELDNLRETLAQRVEAIEIPAHWTLDGRQGFHECRNAAAALVRGSDDE